MSKILGVADPLLTTAEVASRIGKCRDTVTRAVREGRLRPVMQLPTKGAANGAYLFEESAVIEWRKPGDRLPGL